MSKDADMSPEPKSVIQELFRRGAEGDFAVIDELVAEDMLNHAAPGKPGREGWKQIIGIVETDLGEDYTIDHHHFVAEGELVCHHMTMRGRHQASTMPLLTGVPVTGNDVSWTYMHLWRVVDGKVVEHWACRDDVGLLRQVGAWPARA